MNRIILLTLVFLLPGCAVYKITPTLDDRLTVSGRSFSNNSSLVIHRVTDKNRGYPIDGEIEFLINRLRDRVSRDFSSSGKYKITITSFIKKYPFAGKGFQCFEPYLLVLSLGIIPSICEQEYRLTLDIEDVQGKELRKKELTYKVDSVAGWLSLFYAPSSEWTYKLADVERQAFFTLINDVAGK